MSDFEKQIQELYYYIEVSAFQLAKATCLRYTKLYYSDLSKLLILRDIYCMVLLIEPHSSEL